jgi:aminomethyltransferase
LPTRHSPFYNEIVALGATMGRVGGDFVSAHFFEGVEQEHLNTRRNVGVQDLSTMGKIDIKGPDAEQLVNYVIVNDVRGMKPSQARYSTVCQEDGGIMDDLTVFKLGSEHFMMVSGSVNRWKMLSWVSRHADGRRAYVTDLTAATAFPTIQGPRSRDLLKAIAEDIDLDGLKRWSSASARIGETAVRISRTGVTGELGFELFVPADEATVVWRTLMQAGSDFGLKPYGVLAMFTLGLEKGYPAHGIDMDESRTPFHLSLDRMIKFDKDDFVGRSALLLMRDNGPDERWVGLILDGDRPAAAGAPVLCDGEVAGVVTYSDHGYSVGKTLATAHLRLPFNEIGTELDIHIDGTSTRAVVASMPFFDTEGKRLRA